MVVRTNLAANPFTNRRLLSFGLGAVILLSAVLTRQFMDRVAIAEGQARVAQEQVETQQRQINEFRRQLPQTVTPDQLSARERQLLTEAAVLIEQRMFPWSKFLEDLEANLDKDVRLISVNVGLADLTNVDPSRPGTAPMEVSMVLIGKQLDNTIETLNTLRASGHFGRPRLRKQSVLEGTQEVQFEVETVYRP